MSITYKVRFENFDGLEFKHTTTASVVFIEPAERSFKCFVKELENRAKFLDGLEVAKDFKLYYFDEDKDKIEIKDQYDFAIFVRKHITNVTAAYQLPEFDDFEECAEYVKMFTPDGRFPGM